MSLFRRNKYPNITELEKSKDISGLVNALKTENKEEAQSALVRIGASSITTLVNYLKKEKDIRDSLGKIITQIMKSDPSTNHQIFQISMDLLTQRKLSIKAWGIRFLAEIGDAFSILALKTLILHDTSWEVRQEVAKVLGDVGGSEAYDLLIYMIKDPEELVRMFLVSSLSSLMRKGDDRALAALMVLAKEDPSPRIREMATKYAKGHLSKRSDNPICDVCSQPIILKECYCLTTEQITTNPMYWKFVFSHQWAATHISFPNGDTVGFLVANQAGQSTSWFICESCSNLFQFDRETSRLYAEEGGIAGTGPADPHRVAVAAASAWKDLYGSFPNSIIMK